MKIQPFNSNKKWFENPSIPDEALSFPRNEQYEKQESGKTPHVAVSNHPDAFRHRTTFACLLIGKQIANKVSFRRHTNSHVLRGTFYKWFWHLSHTLGRGRPMPVLGIGSYVWDWMWYGRDVFGCGGGFGIICIFVFEIYVYANGFL